MVLLTVFSSCNKHIRLWLLPSMSKPVLWFVISWHMYLSPHTNSKSITPFISFQFLLSSISCHFFFPPPQGHKEITGHRDHTNQSLSDTGSWDVQRAAVGPPVLTIERDCGSELVGGRRVECPKASYKKGPGHVRAWCGDKRKSEPSEPGSPPNKLQCPEQDKVQ